MTRIRGHIRGVLRALQWRWDYYVLPVYWRATDPILGPWRSRSSVRVMTEAYFEVTRRLYEAELELSDLRWDLGNLEDKVADLTDGPVDLQELEAMGVEVR